MAGTRRHGSGNLIGHAKGVSDTRSLATWTKEQFDPELDWNDVQWIKQRWGGKLILKGIMDGQDARLAAASGADAMVVSNHGDRQLDGAPSSIAALPATADAGGSRIEVLLDSGIRSGQVGKGVLASPQDGRTRVHSRDDSESSAASIWPPGGV